MTRSKTLLTLAVGLSALTLAACGAKQEPKKDPAATARTVRVVSVQERSITGSLTASGSLIPREEAAVAPEVSGYRVARVLVEEGAYVKAGQTLAQLDDALLNAQLAQQKAQAEQAEAQAQQAEAEAARVAGLDGQGVLSQEAIDQRRYQAKSSRASANAALAAYREVQTRARKLAVTAPVSGLVLARNVRPGDQSGAAGDPWFRIARDGQIELSADLSQEDLARVRVGQLASVTLPSGGTVEGRVRIVSPQINPDTKLGTVRILLPVRGDIRAGGFGRAVFQDASASGLTVPETAVRYDADGASVMVVGADNRVKRVNVVTGARGGGLVTLTKGPPAGTRVIQNAAAFLLDGDLVKPVEGNATPAAAPAPAKAAPQAAGKR
mgnify:CR=1 FL=1